MKIERVAIVTLGCKVNQYESDAIAHDFSERGYELTRTRKEADIIIINTCCVTKTAESKSRRMIRHLRRENSGALIIVTGCYSQRAGHELLEEGVSLVTGNAEKENLVDLVEEVRQKPQPQMEVSNVMCRHRYPKSKVKEKETNRIRTYLKIQDGCDQCCTYCIVPYVRGPVVSRPFDDIMTEARCLSDQGFKELVLTGIHTGFYGKDLAVETNLTKVLKGLVAETKIERIRISSIEPKEVTDELVDLMASEPRICPHLHIPLQSGDNGILEAMGRHYSREFYLNLAERIYQKIPDAALSADIMVGFPGESQGAFENTIDVVRRVKYAFIHAFPYSPRPGTKAAIFPHRVPGSLKEERQKQLLALGEETKNQFAEKFLGHPLEVLVENKDSNGYYQGHTGNFLLVKFLSEKRNLAGKIVTVLAETNGNGVIFGKEIKE